MPRIHVEAILVAALLTTSIWTPIVFAGYAVGRKRVTVRFWFSLITAEAVSLLFTACVARALEVGWH